MKPPEFDVTSAHRYFAAQCFNLTWKLMDKPDRTPEEDEHMLWLTHASLWHWTQRSDCSPRNLSIGYWQASRVYSLLNRASDALRYAHLCFAITPNDDPFLMGYAHEAIARAALLSGDRPTADEHLAQAQQYVERVADMDDRQMLDRDLHSLRLS